MYNTNKFICVARLYLPSPSDFLQLLSGGLNGSNVDFVVVVIVIRLSHYLYVSKRSLPFNFPLFVDVIPSCFVSHELVFNSMKHTLFVSMQYHRLTQTVFVTGVILFPSSIARY